MARTTPTMERPQLAATLRTIVGSRAIRRLRHEGLIPGVVYGKSTKPMSVSVNGRELTKLLHARSGGEHALVTLTVEQNGKHKEQPVIIHYVQHDPVRGGVTHIDFHAIRKHRLFRFRFWQVNLTRDHECILRVNTGMLLREALVTVVTRYPRACHFSARMNKF